MVFGIRSLLARKDDQLPQERSTMRCNVAYRSRIVYKQVAVRWLQYKRQMLKESSKDLQNSAITLNSSDSRVPPAESKKTRAN